MARTSRPPCTSASASDGYVGAIWRGLRGGAGARYSYGVGQPNYPTAQDESDHVLFLPALLGWAWRSPSVRSGAEPNGYLENAASVHGEIPFHVGLRF